MKSTAEIIVELETMVLNLKEENKRLKEELELSRKIISIFKN